jgi:hypothetical protein
MIQLDSKNRKRVKWKRPHPTFFSNDIAALKWHPYCSRIIDVISNNVYSLIWEKIESTLT